MAVAEKEAIEQTNHGDSLEPNMVFGLGHLVYEFVTSASAGTIDIS